MYNIYLFTLHIHTLFYVYNVLFVDIFTCICTFIYIYVCVCVCVINMYFKYIIFTYFI